MSSYSTLWCIYRIGGHILRDLAPTSLGMVEYIKSNSYGNDCDIDTYPFIVSRYVNYMSCMFTLYLHSYLHILHLYYNHV